MKRDFLVILVITLIVVVIWVASDLAHTKSDANNLPDVQKYLEPITPQFDQQTVERIGNLQTPAPASSSLPQPSTLPTSSPKATPLATPQVASQSASPSATPR